MTNILITGATGLLGSNLVSYLLGQKFAKRIIIITRGIVSPTHYPFASDVLMLTGDINDFEFVDQVMNHYNIDQVYHLAAEAIVSASNDSPLRALNTNIIGTVNVLESARQNHVKGIIAMASDKFYGQSKEIPYKEEYAPKPEGVYEVSKTCSDMICNMYIKNYGLPVISVRGSNLFGPGDMNFTRLVPNSIMRLIQGEKPFLWSDVGEYIREFIYVKDAVEILTRLMDVTATNPGSVNLGVGQIFKVKDFVREIINAVNDIRVLQSTEIEFKDKENFFGEIPEQSLDLRKLTYLLEGKIPTRTSGDLSGCLKTTYHFYHQYSRLCNQRQDSLNRW